MSHAPISDHPYRPDSQGQWRTGRCDLCGEPRGAHANHTDDVPLACWEKQLLSSPPESFLCALPTGHNGPCHDANRVTRCTAEGEQLAAIRRMAEEAKEDGGMIAPVHILSLLNAGGES
jgi:hypothetical protein